MNDTNESASAEPWYREGLSFRCTQCGNCCTGEPGVVWVDDAEIRAIAEHLGKPVGEIRLKHTRPFAGRVSLTEFTNGDCTFLDPATRGCRVYPVRPKQCRTWPFWNSNLESRDAWNAAATGCPGMGCGDVYSLEQIEDRAGVIDV